jgi:hypothetical protein
MSEALIQRALQMSAPVLLAFVKKRVLSRAQLRLVIEDLAAARRAPGQTRKQAYDNFVTNDTLGIELHRSATESLQAPATRADNPCVVKTTDAYTSQSRTATVSPTSMGPEQPNE